MISMPIRAAPKGAALNMVNDASEIKDGIILKGKLKIVTRDITIPTTQAYGYNTSAADIGGVVLSSVFTSATADANATSITATRFNSGTGALYVYVNANPANPVVVRVSILQAV